MPVVFYFRGTKFFFFSNEGSPREPIHVHVRRGEKLAKFWIFPDVRAAESFGFSSKELNSLAKIIETRRDEIEEAWNEHFGA